MFLLVPGYPGCPGSKAVKRSSLLSQMKLTISLKELLSSSKTKSSLTAMFAELVVVYGTKSKSYNFEENHTHEEADTLIPHQVLALIAENDWREVCVWLADTNVLTILLDLASRGRLGSKPVLSF